MLAKFGGNRSLKCSPMITQLHSQVVKVRMGRGSFGQRKKIQCCLKRLNYIALIGNELLRCCQTEILLNAHNDGKESSQSRYNFELIS
jgi:hypothetical protein